MSEIAGLTNAVWGITVAAECLLLTLLLLRRNYREYLAFFLYISANLLQTVALLVSYRKWAIGSFVVYEIAWATQGVAMIGRALAVAEICHHQFERFRGVWELIRRILLVSAAVVLVSAVIVARHNRLLIMPNIQRGLNLAIATCLVGLFVFARYYQIPPSSKLGALALGFLLFSCFGVLNATVLERVLRSYNPVWTLLEMVAFLASVLIWTGAVWQPYAAVARKPMLASSDLYRTLAPDVNLKLRRLNEHLSRFWKVDADQQ
jgi:hypothetical protein